MAKLDSIVSKWTLLSGRTQLRVLSLLVVGALLQPVFGETYQQNRAITEPGKITSLRRSVSSAVRSNNAPDATAKRAIVTYYRGVILNGMTNSSAWQNADQFPAWRRQVIGDLEACRNSSTRRFIRDLIFKYAGQIFTNSKQPTYHPAAKYNAILLFGALDDRPAQGSGSGRKPAVPAAKARSILLKYAAKAPQEELRVGALIGLARHAKLLAAGGAAPDMAIRDLFVNLVRKTEPDAGMSEDGLRWMQRVALEGLGDIGDPRVAKFVLVVMNNQEAPLSVRCAAADAVGRLRYGGDRKPNATVVQSLGGVALDSLKKQIEHLQLLMEKERQGELRQNIENGEAQEISEILRVRRELKFQLGCVDKALEALGNAVQTPAKTALSSELDTIIKGLDEKNMDPKTLYDKLIQPGLRIETAIKS